MRDFVNPSLRYYPPQSEIDGFRKPIILYVMDLFHVLNRGVEKRTLFVDSRDYARFVHDMYEFNDAHPVENTRRHVKENAAMTGFRNPSYDRERIVDIHGWCLMKNHYHLLLSEVTDGGISLFMRKLNVGYANYFNERYKRQGALFQGKTKKKHIDSDAYFLHILHYIHLNPLDYLASARNWRLREVSNHARALKHLENYRWSSFLDYCGTKNFPSILTTDMFADLCNQQRMLDYLRDIELTSARPYLLE